jgi:hypothetical protein
MATGEHCTRPLIHLGGTMSLVGLLILILIVLAVLALIGRRRVF